MGRAQEKGLFTINLINIRDFSLDKHKKVDDYVFGGGDGMLMTPQPLYDAIMSVKRENSHVVYMSPKGCVLSQGKVKEISSKFVDFNYFQYFLNFAIYILQVIMFHSMLLYPYLD